MEGYKTCLVWVLGFILWVLTGILTYNWVDPKGFVQTLVWLVVWHIAETIVMVLLYWLIFELLKKKEVKL